MKDYLRSAGIVLGLLLVQKLFVPFVIIGGIAPDLLLIWVVYYSLRRGQIQGATAGFLVGLLEDLASTQFFGLGALSKTVAGFVAGYFFNENKTWQTLGTYRFLFLVMLCAALHMLVYVPLLLLGSEEFESGTIAVLVVFTTLYTSAISALPMFAFSRKSSE